MSGTVRTTCTAADSTQPANIGAGHRRRNATPAVASHDAPHHSGSRHDEPSSSGRFVNPRTITLGEFTNSHTSSSPAASAASCTPGRPDQTRAVATHRIVIIGELTSFPGFSASVFRCIPVLLAYLVRQSRTGPAGRRGMAPGGGRVNT